MLNELEENMIYKKKKKTIFSNSTKHSYIGLVWFVKSTKFQILSIKKKKIKKIIEG